MLRKIALAFVAVTFVSIATDVASAAPKAIYDPATGNVKFDGFDNVFSARFFSTSGALKPNLGADLGFALTEKTATLYSWLTFGPGITNASLNVGDIVTPGTPLADLSFDYAAGSLTAPITPGVIELVPEPATFAMAGIGLIGCVAARRRFAA